MLFWFLAFLMGFIGLGCLARDGARFLWRGADERILLRRVSHLLRELEELLMAGMLPEAERWAALERLPNPWRALAWEGIQELRARGAPILPTLKRLRAFADESLVAWSEARARSSQALVQAMACGGMVPLLGTSLYWLLPGMERHALGWLGACAAAVMGAGLGALWMLAMADQARWAGLAHDQRVWMFESQVAGERFLGAVRGGLPPDLAWAQVIDQLAQRAPGLARAWRPTLWGAAPENRDLAGPHAASPARRRRARRRRL